MRSAEGRKAGSRSTSCAGMPGGVGRPQRGLGGARACLPLELRLVIAPGLYFLSASCPPPCTLELPSSSRAVSTLSVHLLCALLSLGLWEEHWVGSLWAGQVLAVGLARSLSEWWMLLLFPPTAPRCPNGSPAWAPLGDGPRVLCGLDPTAAGGRSRDRFLISPEFCLQCATCFSVHFSKQGA